MTSSVKSLGGSAIGAILGDVQQDRIKSAAPSVVTTGTSSFDPQSGTIKINPRIRRNTRRFRRNIRSLIPDAGEAFDVSAQGIRDLQARSAELRADFEGNESAFREAQLAPLNEAIARREGEIDRELGRTGVRGTFAQQSRSAFDLDAARERRRAEAEIEDQRISRLGEFMQIDASFLDAALSNETGRIALVGELESVLGNIATEEFNREMQALGLPATFMAANVADAQAQNNAAGIQTQNILGLAGDILDLF